MVIKSAACYPFKAFARLSAVYGGTYMLNKPECKVTYFSRPYFIVLLFSSVQLKDNANPYL